MPAAPANRPPFSPGCRERDLICRGGVRFVRVAIPVDLAFAVLSPAGTWICFPQPGHFACLPAAESSTRNAFPQWGHLNVIMPYLPFTKHTRAVGLDSSLPPSGSLQSPPGSAGFGAGSFDGVWWCE